MTIINCKEDNKFEQDRRIIHSCNREFYLEESKVFYAEALGYFDDIIGQYYTICPFCGYLVLLEESILSDNQKKEAIRTYREDPYEYRKNSLKSELIHLESKTLGKNIRVRVRSFY